MINKVQIEVDRHDIDNLQNYAHRSAELCRTLRGLTEATQAVLRESASRLDAISHNLENTLNLSIKMWQTLQLSAARQASDGMSNSAGLSGEPIEQTSLKTTAPDIQKTPRRSARRSKLTIPVVATAAPTEEKGALRSASAVERVLSGATREPLKGHLSRRVARILAAKENPTGSRRKSGWRVKTVSKRGIRKNRTRTGTATRWWRR
jgi:hypothetical protein